MVEGLVGEFVEAALQITLDDVDTVLDGSQDVGVVDFNADAMNAAGLDQVLE